MKKLLIVGLAALAVACGEVEEDNSHDAQTKCAGQEGNEQCMGDKLQTCTGGVWVDTTDCAATNKVCNAGATAGTASCGNPPSQYDFEGFTPAQTVVNWDTDLFVRHTVTAVEGSGSNIIIVENWAQYSGSLTPGQSSTQTLGTAPNDKYSTCGTCVLGIRSSGSSSTIFLGTVGTVSGTVPLDMGGATNLTLTNIQMKEATATNDGDIVVKATGAKTWFVASATLTAATSSRYSCDLITSDGTSNGTPLAVDQAVCASEFQAAKCTADGLAGDFTCTDAVQKCSDGATFGTTSCVDFPCNDPALEGYTTTEGQSLCWTETMAAVCTAGILEPGTTCTAPQVCQQSNPVGSTQCANP